MEKTEKSEKRIDERKHSSDRKVSFIREDVLSWLRNAPEDGLCLKRFHADITVPEGFELKEGSVYEDPESGKAYEITIEGKKCFSECELLRRTGEKCPLATGAAFGKERTPEAKVLAVCISEKKGEQKHPVDEIKVKENHGIIGDAHAGNWHRQISLLGKESVDKLRDKLPFELKAGDFAENILTEGLTLYELPVGTRLQVGETVLEVTQIGKECHNGCKIRELTGDCVMPREGIFCKVIREGAIRAGDLIRIIGENTER